MPVSNPNEEIRRKRAFEDYWMLPQFGLRRNPNQLYEWYIQRLHDDPTERGNIATTNRATVYKWHKEDKWDQLVMERVEAETEQNAKKYSALRNRGYDKLNTSITKAVETLYELLTAEEQKIRLQAAEAILDRVGLIRASTKDTRHQTSAPTEEARIIPDVPAEDASEQDVMMWLTEQTRE